MKDSEPAAAKPFDVKDVEEGELQVGDTLLSLGRGELLAAPLLLRIGSWRRLKG